jgi:hypothetical protein
MPAKRGSEGRQQAREARWSKMLLTAGVVRLLTAFNSIADRRIRKEVVWLAERIAGVKSIPRKKRSK